MPAPPPPTSRTRSSQRKSDPLARYRDRLTRVRKAVKAAGCEALLITNPSDIRYLSPFGGEASAALVLPRSFVVISDRRFEEELWELKGLAKVVMRSGPMAETLGPLMKEHGATYAFQSEDCTVAMRQSLVKHVGAKSMVATLGLMTGVRAIKDEHEIKALKKAIKIQEKALGSVFEQVNPGWTEAEIAALLEYEMRVGGAEGAAFEIISAAGPNGSKAHYRPAKAKVKQGRSLLIDWGAIYDGYRSDMTRTVSFGSWQREIGKIYDIVLDAYNAGVGAIGVGVRAKDVDAAARAVITDAGYGKAFGHSLGHGVGLDVHEMPSLSSLSEWTLEENMVVTVEPGIYLPGVGGVRLENDILVTPRGGRNLCSLPMDKGWATL